MPDKFGFQILGAEVACIDCDLRGPVWEWPEKLRAQHQAGHVRARERAARQAARDRAREGRRLAKMKDRENKIAYGDGDS